MRRASKPNADELLKSTTNTQLESRPIPFAIGLTSVNLLVELARDGSGTGTAQAILPSGDADSAAIRKLGSGKAVRENRPFPGLRAIPAPGHTPGHTFYLLESRATSWYSWAM
jgi:glyoxylase-like metal-dependent hydrolase (beta-lactamase superfamily II)